MKIKTHPLFVILAAASIGFGALPVIGGLILSLNFEDFSGTVTNAATVNTANAGSAAGNAVLQAFGAGTITSTVGPAGGGDVAIELNDANTLGGVNARGGQLSYMLPAITGDYTVALNIRLDGVQVLSDRIFETPSQLNILQIDTGLNDIRSKVSDRELVDDLAFADGVWKHITITYDHDGGDAGDTDGLVTWYIDGVAIGDSEFVNNNSGAASLNAGLQNVFFGSQASGNRPLNGAMDNIALYDSLLDSTAVANLYAVTIPEPSSLNLILICGLALVVLKFSR